MPQLSNLHTNSATGAAPTRHDAFQRHRPAWPTGTFQISCAYSLMARSDENQAMCAMFSMHIRVQSDDDMPELVDPALGGGIVVEIRA